MILQKRNNVTHVVYYITTLQTKRSLNTEDDLRHVVRTTLTMLVTIVYVQKQINAMKQRHEVYNSRNISNM